MESRRSSLASVPILKHIPTSLRGIRSVDTLRIPDDGTVSVVASPESKKRFRFPKLALQDKKKRDIDVMSCIEISPRIPSDDARIHEDELDCCPPCDPPDVKSSKYFISAPALPGPQLKVEPSDLACFLAGCPPSHANCEHHKRRNSISYRDSMYDGNIGEDFTHVSEGFARDVAKLGLSISGMEIGPTLRNANTSEDRDEGLLAGSNSKTPQAERVRSREDKRPILTPKILRSPPRMISPTSSVTSGSIDAFPLANYSSELAAEEEAPQRFSTSVATTFSLPGYNAKVKRASVILRSKLSESSSNATREVQPAVIQAQETEPLSAFRISSKKDEEKMKIRGVTSIETLSEQKDFVVDVMERSKSSTGIVASPKSLSHVTDDDSQVAKPLSSADPVDESAGVPPSKAPLKSGTAVNEPPRVASDASLRSQKSRNDDAVRSMKSTGLTRSKPQSPSLLSRASRSSAIRHALLKPSITDSQPFDTGLPVPPILTPVASISEKIMPTGKLESAAGRAPTGLVPSERNYVEARRSIGDDEQSNAPIAFEPDYFEALQLTGEVSQTSSSSAPLDAEWAENNISSIDPHDVNSIRPIVSLKSSKSIVADSRNIATLRSQSNISKPADTRNSFRIIHAPKKRQSIAEALETGADDLNNTLATIRTNSAAERPTEPETSRKSRTKTPPVQILEMSHLLSRDDDTVNDQFPSPVAGHLTNLQKARQLVDSVRGRIQEAEEEMSRLFGTTTGSKESVTVEPAPKSRNKSPRIAFKDPTAFPAPSATAVNDLLGRGSAAIPPESSRKNVPVDDTQMSVEAGDPVPCAAISPKNTSNEHVLAECQSPAKERGPGLPDSLPQTGENRAAFQGSPKSPVQAKESSSQPTTQPETARAATKLTEQSTAHPNNALPPITTQPDDPRPSADPLNPSYWGFVPAVKEAVQDAVQTAVRNAVQEIVVPPGSQRDEASDGYWVLVADSLTRAARTADEYLRSASLWNEAPDSLRRESETTVIVSNPAEDSRTRASDWIENLASPKKSLRDFELPVDAIPPRGLPSENSRVASPVAQNQENGGLGSDQPKRGSTKSNLARTGVLPGAFEIHDNLTLTPKPFSPDGMETIPLESGEKLPLKEGKPGWKLPNAFKQGSSVGYISIPDRRSSRNRVLSPKTTATNSLSRFSPEGTVTPPSRKRSFERIMSRSYRQLRSISSVGSLRTCGSDHKDSAREKLIPQKEDSDPYKEGVPAPRIPSVDKFGRKNTVHWLKELLSSNGPYEPRFTNLPPRTRGASNKPLRSQIAPVKPVTELFLGKTRLREDHQTDDTELGSVKSKRQMRVDPSETFSKTINDLENLMNEALLIARQAADTQGPSLVPELLGSAMEVLKSGRITEKEDNLGPNFRKRRSYSVLINRRSDVSSVPSIHESLRSVSSYSNSDISDKAELPPTPPELAKVVRSITVSAKERTSRSPGWPPNDRASTPFPPVSRQPSAFSSPSRQATNGPTGRIGNVDPRSLPTENDVELPRQRTISFPMGSNTRGSCKHLEPDFRRSTSLHPLNKRSKTADDDSLLTESPPEFRTLEPFDQTSRQDTRKSSERSPTRLSPTKRSRASRGDIDSPTALETNDVPRDLCGDPMISVLASTRRTEPLPQLTPMSGTAPRKCAIEHSEEEHLRVTSKLALRSVPSKREVRDFIQENLHPPITPRASSLMLRGQAEKFQARSKAISGMTAQTGQTGQTYNWQDIDRTKIEKCSQLETRAATAHLLIPQDPVIIPPRYSHSFDGSQISHSEVMDFETGYGVRIRGGVGEARGSRTMEAIELRDIPDPNLPETSKAGAERNSKNHHLSLSNKRHVSLRDHHLKGFSLARSHKRQTIARDWSSGRKRFVASVACFSTALIGIVVGVYAGETPAIQYYIVDFHHYTVLGNVFFFIGLSIPTFFFWPLPLLHGRKPYILGSMSLAMPLLFPQALAVGQFRSPYIATWRIGLILPRALMGFVLGFANMNFKQMLTDLFGASLQSSNPHQEHVDEFDVRRHGGGMGIWLGLWTWSALGSIGLGFLIGAAIINSLNPAWGFYVTIAIIAFVMFLNVLCPEVRRSAYRRSVAEVVNGEAVSRRLARGEVKMHMVQTGPKWWGEEFHYGVMLSKKMLRQPGFMIMALYVAWIYGQMVLIILLLGALMSKDYKLKSPGVGASVMAIPIGAFLSIPFQKAGIFSRARKIAPSSDDATLVHKKVKWTSHMVRRTIFVLCLPFAGLAYTLSSGGPPIPFILPILFAGVIGFLSNLAMAECHGIIMELFDTSDLQPGMTGRARGSAGDSSAAKRKNYSSFPRVASAFAITQGMGYLVAAAASGVGGILTRHLGQQSATGVMAGVLLILSVLLLLVLIRFTNVQIIPDSKKEEMDRYHNARKTSAQRREEGIEEEEPWRPIIIGNPHHHCRRMCLLELGAMSRFSEIRLKNKLIDVGSLEAKHPNRAAMEDAKHHVKEVEQELVHHVRQSLSRHSSRHSRRSKSDVPEQGDLGGHREMLKRGGSGNGSGRRAPGSGRKGTSMQRRGIEE